MAKDLTTTLQSRYTAILESDSDRSFYQNVHRYIHFIVKTPVLAKIIDESEKEYRQKHADIWREYKRTDEEIDLQVERTRKLERFSLYASDYCWIFERIYRPLENYRTSDELKGKYATCSNIMLGQVVVKKNSPENIKMFGKWYVDKRKSYTKHIQNLHQDFLPIVEQLKEAEEAVRLPVIHEDLKPIIIIDDKKGIYQKFNEQSAYAVKKGSKRFKLIRHLLTTDSASISKLAEITDQSENVTIKAVAEVNHLFMEKAGQAYDLISHTDTVGYFLNRDTFQFEISQNS
jgi:hypothetical protein